MQFKKSLVYGVIYDNLVLLPESVAKAYADDHQNIWQLKTYGDARRFEPLGLNVAPGLDPDDFDELPADDDPYDAALTSEVTNGDWPPSAATIALDHLPDDCDDVGEERDGFVSSPYLFIDPLTESELLMTLRERGYDVRRDDDLIGRI